MANNRTNPVWKLSVEQLATIIKESQTYKEVLSRFGLKNSGNSHRVLKKRMELFSIAGNHLGKRWHAIAKHSQDKSIPLSEILIEDSAYNRTRLKKRIIQNGIIQNKCALCNIEPYWNGAFLSLELHHVNGKYRDNRVENLILLCPNCHSQQNNHSGRNKKYKNIKTN